MPGLATTWTCTGGAGALDVSATAARNSFSLRRPAAKAAASSRSAKSPTSGGAWTCTSPCRVAPTGSCTNGIAPAKICLSIVESELRPSPKPNERSLKWSTRLNQAPTTNTPSTRLDFAHARAARRRPTNRSTDTQIGTDPNRAHTVHTTHQHQTTDTPQVRVSGTVRRPDWAAACTLTTRHTSQEPLQSVLESQPSTPPDLNGAVHARLHPNSQPSS